MQNQLEKKVVGEWELESFVVESPDRKQTEWGKEAHGLLIYTGSGKVSVSINKEINSESDDDFENIYDSILFYSGTYKIDGNRILHNVTQASNPKRIGKELVRFAELQNERLRLITPEESFGRGILVWKRIQSA